MQNKINYTLYDMTCSEDVERLKNVSSLSDGKMFIYIMKNAPQGNIKVGKTSNIYERYSSLSGSNGGGNQIVKIALSPATYLYTIEKIGHIHFDKYRIPNTEWFRGDKVSFKEIFIYMNSLFNSSDYNTCNELRKKIMENK